MAGIAKPRDTWDYAHSPALFVQRQHRAYEHFWQDGGCTILQTGLKQGCPLNPTLSGLFADSECKGISKPPVLRKALMCVGMIKRLLSGMLMILCCWLVLHKASAAH